MKTYTAKQFEEKCKITESILEMLSKGVNPSVIQSELGITREHVRYYRDKLGIRPPLTVKSKHPEYKSTQHSLNNAKRRCNSKNHHRYKHYGGRGIKVCERWSARMIGLNNFIDDMGFRPKGFTIERIDTNGNYEPGNCKWVPAREQSGNRRNNFRIEFDGKTLTAFDWSKITGINANTIYGRMRCGWDVKDALTMRPIEPKKKPYGYKKPTHNEK